MYNKSFDEVIDLIKENTCVMKDDDYLKRLFGRLRDDDGYDIHRCLELNINPDYSRFSTFDQFLHYVYQKCKCNIYYFLRNVIKPRSTNDGKFADYQLNIGTLSLIEHYLYGRSALLENPRQTGQTFTNICISVYESLFKLNNASIDVIARNTVSYRNIESNIIDGIPDSFKTYIEKINNDNDTETKYNFDPKKKMVFIDDLEFCDMLLLKDAIASNINNCNGKVLYYATSTINGKLNDEDLAYLKSITFDIIDDFNTICPLSHGALQAGNMDRVWYDVKYFYTTEERDYFRELLGPNAYKCEILRIR